MYVFTSGQSPHSYFESAFFLCLYNELTNATELNSYC